MILQGVSQPCSSFMLSIALLHDNAIVDFTNLLEPMNKTSWNLMLKKLTVLGLGTVIKPCQIAMDWQMAVVAL